MSYTIILLIENMNKLILIGILLLTSFFLFGCTESDIVLPYNTIQFINQSTDLNLIDFQSGVYDGNFLSIDGNKLSITVIDFNDEEIPWSSLIDFPSGCSDNQAVKIVGSSLVCVDLPTDSDYVPYTGATDDVDLGANDLIVNTNTLFVDSVNDIVGIGTDEPNAKLDIIDTDYLFNIRNSVSPYGTALDKTIGAFGFNNIANNSGITNAFALRTSKTSQVGLLSDVKIHIDLLKAFSSSDKYGIIETGKATALTIDGEGKVGIGKTTPEQKLHIYGDDDAYVMIEGATNHDSGLRMWEDTVSAYGYGASLFYNAVANQFQIRTHTGSDTGILRLAINRDNGYVGINTDSPNELFNILGDTDAYIQLDSATNYDTGLRMWEDSGYPGGVGSSLFYNGADNEFQIRTHFNDNTGVKRFSIDRSTGITTIEKDLICNDNVGIGTTSPDTKLQVVGDTKFGNDENYLEISDNGVLTLNGNARVFKTEWVTIAGLKVPGTKPAEFVDWGINGGLEFSDGTDDTAVTTIRLPQDMDKSVAPDYKIGFASDATSGDVVWQLEYLYVGPNEDTTASAQETLTVTKTISATSDGLTVATVSGMDLPSDTDQLLILRIKRLGADANDTIADDAILLGTGLNYTVNKLGVSIYE